MKKIVSLSILILIFSFNGNNRTVLEENDYPESRLRAIGWHDLTQAQRNQAILSRAYQDNGQYVGLDCKQWVKAVVAAASDNCVLFPLRANGPYDWYWNIEPYINGRLGLIQSAVPGEIIRMIIKSNGGPHVAIVAGITSTQITFIESNWCNSAACKTVSTRTMAFSVFYDQVSDYAIYRIL